MAIKLVSSGHVRWVIERRTLVEYPRLGRAYVGKLVRDKRRRRVWFEGVSAVGAERICVKFRSGELYFSTVVAKFCPHCQALKPAVTAECRCGFSNDLIALRRPVPNGG